MAAEIAGYMNNFCRHFVALLSLAAELDDISEPVIIRGSIRLWIHFGGPLLPTDYKINFAVLIFAVLVVAGPVSAQIPSPKPAPLAPVGVGGCSVQKGCSELAPDMIQSALGASPLEQNLRYLTDTIGGRVTGSPAADRAVGWAV